MSRLVRVRGAGAASYGEIHGDSITLIDGDVFDSYRPSDRQVALETAELLKPVDPLRVQKVIGVSNNHQNPAMDARTAPHPQWFAKLPSSLGLHRDDIELPASGFNLNFEGELVAIIKRGGRGIALEDAESHILGYTIGNDWSENTWYVEKNGWQEPSRVISKSVDGWAALYPVIFTDFDPADRQIEIRLNGKAVARGNTSAMINSPASLIHYISKFVTLSPGDVIFTGTVAPPVFEGERRNMFAGDVVDVEIDGMGTLTNTVRLVGSKDRSAERNPLTGRSIS